MAGTVPDAVPDALAALRARRLAGGAGGAVGRSGVRAVLVTVLLTAGPVRVALAGLTRRRLTGTGAARADTTRADTARCLPPYSGRPVRPARAVLLAGNLARLAGLLSVRVAGLTAVRAGLPAVLVTAVLAAAVLAAAYCRLAGLAAVLVTAVLLTAVLVLAGLTAVLAAGLLPAVLSAWP